MILGSADTLSKLQTEEMIVVFLFIAIFLVHVRSELGAIVTLPVAVLASFIANLASGVTLNIMSLGGIIIGDGDATVVLVENAHR